MAITHPQSRTDFFKAFNGAWTSRCPDNICKQSEYSIEGETVRFYQSMGEKVQPQIRIHCILWWLVNIYFARNYFTPDFAHIISADCIEE
jgi:hypothetical protein